VGGQEDFEAIFLACHSDQALGYDLSQMREVPQRWEAKP
jgi:hypothetical protein